MHIFVTLDTIVILFKSKKFHSCRLENELAENCFLLECHTCDLGTRLISNISYNHTILLRQQAMIPETLCFIWSLGILYMFIFQYS